MVSSVQHWIFELNQSGLVPAADLRALLAAHSASETTLAETSFWRLLESEKRLTPFQIEAVRAGKANTLVMGNYVILDGLGAGGMGQVFLAQHRRMKRIVALKVLPRDKVNSAEQVERFQREVEAAARLHHPNIVTAFDADDGPLGYFLVMEYVAGCDLAHYVQERGVLSVRDAVDYVLQVARALDYAHRQGVVHRDIKPANMLRDARGTIKVTDMGLARFTSAALAGESRIGLTLDGAIGGTADFMSPEQAVNVKTADERSDLYSLGCSLYYLLVGHGPYPGESVMEMLLAHREQPVRSLRDKRPDASEALDAIYRGLTAKKPADRYQNAAEVIHFLEICEPASGEPSPVAAAESGNLRIPGTGAREPSPTSWEVGRAITLPDLSVLLVEPSRLQTRVILGQLKELGVERLQSAPSGAEAQAMIAQSRPDVVVSSMHLPDMTGAELVRSLHAADETSRIGFVLISSETDEALLEQVRQAGTAAILPKPFDVDRLRQALTAAVDFFSPEGLRLNNLNVHALQVLVVDDSRSARKHIRRVLENLGIRAITEAADGCEASEILARSSFDLVVTDLNMPRMDGATLVRRLRQDARYGPDLPVLMITSEEDPAQLEQARSAGVSAVCGKVFDVKTVCDILETLIQPGRSRDS